MKNGISKKQQQALDKYLKSKGEFFVQKKYYIEPSPGFMDQTLLKIAEAHDHRVLVTKIWMVVFMYLPFILREIWILTRRDFFSVSNWPFSNYLTSAYSFMISSSTAVYLLAIGIFASFVYLKGFRFIGHVFERKEKAA